MAAAVIAPFERSRVRKKIGECLIQAGLITEEDLQIALAEHKRMGERLGAALVRLNFATENQVTRALAYQLGFPFANLAEEPPDPAVIVLIPKDVALERACVAVRLDKGLLTVAMSDPLLFSLVQDLELQTGHRIGQVVATHGDILKSIEDGYPDDPSARMNDRAAAAGTMRKAGERVVEGAASSPPQREPGESAPIIDLVDLVVNNAITCRASDVHIDPREKGVVVRHRLDGVLKDVLDLPRRVHAGMVARIKVMAGMDIAETHLPQDGRLRVKEDGGQDADFRVSTLPTLNGEKIVLRVLDAHRGAPSLEELGLSAAALEEVKRLLGRPHGMILVVGPGGSGRTTTLMAAIGSIKSNRSNIITIEDPIECRIPGVSQMQVDETAKLTFAAALRATLRQDPDVVLVGELRDEETLRIAMQAAQSGPLVLSTLITVDAPSTMTRLIDMGMAPDAMASALIGIVAQRLVRRLCTSCRRQDTPDPGTLRALSITEAAAAQFPFYRAVGCEECNGTGYRGRVALFEVMRVSDTVRRRIAQDAGEGMLRDAAIGAGMVTLAEDGLARVAAGTTSAEELLRVMTGVRVRTLCPGCAGTVAVDFMACPSCGYRLKPGCGRCGRALEAGWQFCPSCAAPGTTVSPEGRLREPETPRESPPSNLAEFRNQIR